MDDGEVLVVDKPASIPVHPCGRFRHNTVIFILGKERGISELHTVHRLDRLTSGVLLFARTLEISKKLDQLVRDRQVRLGQRGAVDFHMCWNILTEVEIRISRLVSILAYLMQLFSPFCFCTA